LKKGRYYKKDFEYNKSGIVLKAKGDKLNVFEIEKVDENSAASRAKLKVGDELIKVQQHFTENLTLNEIYNIFHVTKEGRSIRLIIRRDGQLLRTKLTLKSIL